MAKDYSAIDGIVKVAVNDMHIAYDHGYKQGFQDGKLSVSKASDQYVSEQCDKAMQMGIEIGRDEVWEAARKIACPPNCYEGGLLYKIEEIFGVDMYLSRDVFTNFSASEALQKIKKYKEKQNPIVKVGDELECAGKHLVVTWINDENRWNGMLRIRQVRQMNDKCYRCCYYDELFDGMDEYSQCACEEDERPEWCPERSNTDGNS